MSWANTKCHCLRSRLTFAEMEDESGDQLRRQESSKFLKKKSVGSLLWNEVVETLAPEFIAKIGTASLDSESTC